MPDEFIAEADYLHLLQDQVFTQIHDRIEVVAWW